MSSANASHSSRVSEPSPLRKFSESISTKSAGKSSSGSPPTGKNHFLHPPLSTLPEQVEINAGAVFILEVKCPSATLVEFKLPDLGNRSFLVEPKPCLTSQDVKTFQLIR